MIPREDGGNIRPEYRWYSFLIQTCVRETCRLRSRIWAQSVYEKSVLFLMELDVDDRYMPGTSSWLI